MTTASVPECKCSLQTSLVGDGCSACNPKLAAEIDVENAAEERLHAAAPDLLAALQAIVRSVALNQCAMNQGLESAALAAIAKAVRP